MKKIILPALLAATALLLYNCTDTDADPLDSTETFDSLQPGDSVYPDTVTYPGGDYPISDTVVQDSIYFPVDSIPGDTIIVIQPFPGEPQPPLDTIAGDSIWAD